jgi:sugar lactone lactonase YvrE
VLPCRLDTTTGIISTYAGRGAATFSGDGGSAISAALYMPMSVAFGPNGLCFIADSSNNRIRAIDPATGAISTVAGNGSQAYGGNGAKATAAAFSLPMQVVVNQRGDLFVADSFNHVVRVVNATTGIVSLVTGVPGFPGFNGDNKPALASQLNFPAGLAFDAQGGLLIADMNNNVVRRVGSSGVMSVVAGTPGIQGAAGDNGPAVSALLSSPGAVAIDPVGNILIADSDNSRIRRVDSSGIITTIAGSTTGFADGNGTAARFNAPVGIAVRPDGVIAVADSRNQRVRLLQCA